MSYISNSSSGGGGGTGTVTSISQGTGITLTPNPITTTGTVSLTIPVTIANGGTNATSMSVTDGTVYYDGTRLVTTATGTSGQVLTSNGAGVAPTFQSGGGGGITTIDGDSGSVTGSTVTFTNNTDAGQTVAFIGSGTTMELIMTDARSNVFLATGAPYSGASLGEMSVVIGPQAVTSGNAERCVVIGWRAGMSLDSGGFSSTDGNVIIGSSAGQVLQTGNNNILIGENTGENYGSSESSNICLNSDGGGGENNTLRIGNGTGTNVQQLAQAFISGIYGITTTDAGALPVLIGNDDQLGTIASSIRYKQNVTDMADRSSRIMQLRPVNFSYKKDDSNSIQYGLIAEEVREIMPELTFDNKEGAIEGVRYHDLPPMLLNELQKLAKRVEELESKLAQKGF